MIEIEYDPEKNEANKSCHGLAFEDVYKLDWNNALYKVDGRKDYGERRFQTFVRDEDGKPFVVVFTLRNDRLRIISFRRAREKERKKFDA